MGGMGKVSHAVCLASLLGSSLLWGCGSGEGGGSNAGVAGMSGEAGTGGAGHGQCPHGVSQPLSAPCCLELGIDACGAGLFCAAFDGREQATCYPEYSRGAGQECAEDRHCLSQRCNSETAQCDPRDGECTPPTLGDASNQYFMGLSLSIAPSKPFLFLVTATIDVDRISFRVQPLDASDGTSPVGSPFLGGPFPIATDGSFVGDFGTVSVDPAANPISGSELLTTLALEGMSGGWCGSSPFVCGIADGVATKPIADLDLAGSTFAMQKLPHPGVYPEPKSACSQAP